MLLDKFASTTSSQQSFQQDIRSERIRRKKRETTTTAKSMAPRQRSLGRGRNCSNNDDGSFVDGGDESTSTTALVSSSSSSSSLDESSTSHAGPSSSSSSKGTTSTKTTTTAAATTTKPPPTLDQTESDIARIRHDYFNLVALVRFFLPLPSPPLKHDGRRSSSVFACAFVCVCVLPVSLLLLFRDPFSLVGTDVGISENIPRSFIGCPTLRSRVVAFVV